MPQFLLGLLLGAISGAITYSLTTDGQLATIAAVIVMVLTWIGVAALLVFDD